MSQDPGQKYFNNGVNFTPTIHHDTYSAIDPTKVNLFGLHVLITGASKGVGKATAVSYAKAGASAIALAARSPLESVVEEVKNAAKQASHDVPQVLALNVDVTDVKSIEAAKQQVSSAFDGRLDVLINNAGRLLSFVPIPETDPDEWWQDYAVNIKGPFLMTRAFWPLLKKSTRKIIINVTSIGAHTLVPHDTAYSPAKLAMLRFNEIVDSDHGPRTPEGMLVFGVHPGGVRTELAMGLPEFLHELLVDEPELPADAMVWLSNERREWLAGRYLSVNWDVEELEARKEEILKGDLLKVRMAVNGFSS